MGRDRPFGHTLLRTGLRQRKAQGLRQLRANDEPAERHRAFRGIRPFGNPQRRNLRRRRGKPEHTRHGHPRHADNNHPDPETIRRGTRRNPPQASGYLCHSTHTGRDFQRILLRDTLCHGLPPGGKDVLRPRSVGVPLHTSIWFRHLGQPFHSHPAPRCAPELSGAESEPCRGKCHLLHLRQLLRHARRQLPLRQHLLPAHPRQRGPTTRGRRIESTQNQQQNSPFLRKSAISGNIPPGHLHQRRRRPVGTHTPVAGHTRSSARTPARIHGHAGAHIHIPAQRIPMPGNGRLHSGYTETRSRLLHLQRSRNRAGARP